MTPQSISVVSHMPCFVGFDRSPKLPRLITIFSIGSISKTMQQISGKNRWRISSSLDLPLSSNLMYRGLLASFLTSHWRFPFVMKVRLDFVQRLFSLLQPSTSPPTIDIVHINLPSLFVISETPAIEPDLRHNFSANFSFSKVPSL